MADQLCGIVDSETCNDKSHAADAKETLEAEAYSL
jgi:hypothetical protein